MVELRVGPDPAGAAAAWITAALDEAASARGRASLAVSGGSSAPQLFGRLLELPVPWDRVGIWQVDERIVPDGHPDRNAGQLAALPAVTHLMPVTATHPEVAADEYAAGLPQRFDVVHLGVGDDGHTASWPPGDATAVDTDRLVVVTGSFHGHRRMTLTPVVVNAAVGRVVFAIGASKASAVERWFAGDPDLPISRVRSDATVAFLDADAAPSRRD